MAPLTSSREASDESGSWLNVAALLLEHSRLIVLASAVGGILAIGVTLLLPKQYTTKVSFTPVAAPGLQVGAGALAGLAGQFGVELGAGDPSSSPDFYASLLQSETILIPLALKPFNVSSETEGAGANYIELYSVTGSDSGSTLSEAIRDIRSKRLNISFDRQTSIVRVSVRTRWRELSQQMGQELLALIDTFNVGSRRSKAAFEERFLSDRLVSVEAELRAAEDRLEQFLRRNRTYVGDPVLEFEHTRLQRSMSLLQGVFSSLSEAHEQARLAAVRNTPSISIIDAATPALRFDRRHTLAKGVAGLIAGAVLAILVVLTRFASSETRRRSPETADRLKHAWRTGLAGVGGSTSSSSDPERQNR